MKQKTEKSSSKQSIINLEANITRNRQSWKWSAPRRAEALQALKNWLKIIYISDLDKNKNWMQNETVGLLYKGRCFLFPSWRPAVISEADWKAGAHYFRQPPPTVTSSAPQAPSPCLPGLLGGGCAITEEPQNLVYIRGLAPCGSHPVSKID